MLPRQDELSSLSLIKSQSVCFDMMCGCPAWPGESHCRAAWPAHNDKETMMVSSHENALQAKHAGLEARIHEELCRPAPDETTLHSLKRQKLKIKEELAHL
jgi:hypothetical protein